MGQDFSIDWVGQQTRPWDSQHGPKLDYKIALAGEEGTVTLTQNAGTAAPEVGQQLHGHIETQHHTRKSDGEAFEVRKFKKEAREDGSAPSDRLGNRGASAAGSQPGTPGPEFWAAKDARISRQGVLQSVVSSGALNGNVGDLGKYIEGIATITDALLESLDKATPSPNNSPGALSGDSSGDAGQVDLPSASTPGEQGAGTGTPAPAPTFTGQDAALALAACGHDNSNPEKTFNSLNPDQRSQVKVIYDNLSSKAEATLGNDDPDSDIPF